jgi:hypothetical protein
MKAAGFESGALIYRHFNAIGPEFVNQQFGFSLTEWQRHNCEPNLPAKTPVRGFILTHGN